MVGGGLIVLFFQAAISPWKKGSGGPKFRDFSYFLRHFQKIKKLFLGDQEGEVTQASLKHMSSMCHVLVV